MSLGSLCLVACDSSGPSSRVGASIDTRTSPGAQLALTCSGCHSDASGAIASLQGYSEAQLRQSLLNYKTDSNRSTVMHRLARGYSDADIALLSAYLGSKPEVE